MAAGLEARPLGSEEAFRPIGEPTPMAPPDYYVLFEVPDWTAPKRGRPGSSSPTSARRDAHLPDRDSGRAERAADEGGGVHRHGGVGRLANAPGGKPREGEAVFGRWTASNIWMPFEQAVAGVLQQSPDLVCYTGDQIYEGKPTQKDPSRHLGTTTSTSGSSGTGRSAR